MFQADAICCRQSSQELRTEVAGHRGRKGPMGQDSAPGRMPYNSFVITMSHSENNGRHHVWERWIQMQLEKGWEEGEYTQATYPH